MSQNQRYLIGKQCYPEETPHVYRGTSAAPAAALHMQEPLPHQQNKPTKATFGRTQQPPRPKYKASTQKSYLLSHDSRPLPTVNHHSSPKPHNNVEVKLPDYPTRKSQPSSIGKSSHIEAPVEVKLPDYPTRKSSASEVDNCDANDDKRVFVLPPQLQKRPSDDFWLQVYQQINKVGGPVDLFIDILEGLITDFVEVRAHALDFYDCLTTLTEGKDLDDLIGLDSLMDILHRLSTGAIKDRYKLLVAIQMSYERLSNVINKIKGLDDALAAADDGYGEIREKISVQVSNGAFPYIVDVINEVKYSSWSQVIQDGIRIFVELQEFIKQFPRTVDELKSNVPGFAEIWNILNRIEHGQLLSVGDLVKTVESSIDQLELLDLDVESLKVALDNYHERHSANPEVDRQIVSLLNVTNGPIHLLEKVMTGVLTEPPAIKTAATSAHRNLVAGISDLTTEPLDSIEQRIVGLKPTVDILKGIMNGTYTTPSEIGNAALISRSDIVIVSSPEYNMEEVFDEFEENDRLEWLKKKIGSKLVESNGAIDFFIGLLNGLFMRQSQDDLQIAQDAARIYNSLVVAISGWSSESLDSLRTKIPSLAYLLDGLSTLVYNQQLSDEEKMDAVSSFVLNVKDLVDKNKAQPLIDAYESAQGRAAAISMRQKIDVLIHQPKGALELVNNILMGKLDITDAKEDAAKVYSDLERIEDEYVHHPKVPELVALLDFFGKLSKDGGFSSESDFANNFAILLYKIEYVNPQNSGKETLHFYVLRIGIQEKVMSSTGAYMYFARVLQEEITDTATMVSEASRVRKELTQEIFALTYDPLETIRSKIGGLGPLLDILNSIQIKSDVNGLDIANMLNNILPTLRPVTTQLERLAEWVEYYLKLHGESGTRSLSAGEAVKPSVLNVDGAFSKEPTVSFV